MVDIGIMKGIRLFLDLFFSLEQGDGGME